MNPLNLINQLNWLNPFKLLWGFVTGKPQLALMYAMIAGLLVMAVAVTTQWGQKKVTEVRLANTEADLARLDREKNQIRHELNIEKNINETQQSKIGWLEEQRAIDEAAMKALRADNQRINLNDRSARDRLKKLEANNAKVREYLNQPIPDELKCLLRNNCPKDSAAGSGNKNSDKDRETGPALRANPALRTAGQ